MITCQFCGFENIEGDDVCDQCGQPLSDSHLRDPQSSVEQGLLQDRIDLLQPRQPVTVAATATVGSVLNTLVENSIGCVIVTNEDQEMLGVFSERDALNRLADKSAEYWDKPISEFMTPSPHDLKSDAKIAFAVHEMDLGHYRHIPITDEGGRPVGVISVRDILQYLTSFAAD